MSTSMDIELIPMEIPSDEGHQMYIKGISWQGIPEHLQFELEKLFSVFGLLYQIVVGCQSEEESETLWYAYIRFYSVRATKAALQHDGKLSIEGKKLKIRRTPRPRPHKKIALPLGKAQELLTQFFGFNCWTSEVVFMERETESAEPDTIQYLCMVRVKMPKEGLCSEGLGLSKVPCDMKSPTTRGLAFSCAHRFAVHAAMKAAFSKFIIITLGNGKCTVEVDTTRHDPLLYDPAWDNPLIKVNNIVYDPENEEECEDLEDLTEEQLDEILNQPL